MDQGRHRCWAFHRVGQPRVQEELRRFAHSADEQQESDDFDSGQLVNAPLQHHVSLLRNHGKDFFELNRAEHKEDGHNAQGKAEIADAVDDKGFNLRVIGRALVIPKANQEIGCEAHAFPAKEELHEVCRSNQRQHGKGEERQIGKEARLMRIFRHIAPAIKVHQRRYAGNDDHHNGTNGIQSDRPGALEVANIDPSRDANGLSGQM